MAGEPKITWLHKLLSALGPAAQGMTLGTWWRLLRENRFKVHPRYWFRALMTTFACVPNTVDAFVERENLAEKLPTVEVPPPLFVLGHWRSGTTHLHNLFSLDERFCYPNLYQCMNPHTFMRTEGLRSKLQQLFLPATRGFDNVALSVDAPYEDEFMGWHATGYSSYMAWSWPDNPRYDTYLTFAEASDEETAAWKQSVLEFFQKLTLKYEGRPLILKSPQHTARVGLLRELFPGAKFVHIHRNPYDIFRSTEKLYSFAAGMATLQKPHRHEQTDRILRQYVEMYETYFRDIEHVPAGHLSNVGFDEVAQEPVAAMERVYAELGLPDFATVKPQIETYVASLGDFKRNVHADIEPELKARIDERWAPYYTRWGY